MPIVHAATIKKIGEARSYPCMVRDISDSGVKLRVPIGLEVPDLFELAVPDLGLVRRARVAWRSAHSIGAKFEP
jgi:hypothetical protein